MMIADTVGYGGNYRVARKPLTDDQIVDVAAQIQLSQEFEFSEFGHVVLRDTKTIVGYVGNDSVELCWPEGENSKKYVAPHSKLVRIFNSV